MSEYDTILSTVGLLFDLTGAVVVLAPDWSLINKRLRGIGRFAVNYASTPVIGFVIRKKVPWEFINNMTWIYKFGVTNNWLEGTEADISKGEESFKEISQVTRYYLQSDRSINNVKEMIKYSCSMEL